ncbi:MAG: hypothetical protein ACE5LB_13795 [Acidiferrobacterales bacterium]
MSYHRALGVVPAQDVLRGQIAEMIWAMRWEGKSDAEIRAWLLAQPTEKKHPCRGPEGENLCVTADIDAAFPLADRLGKIREEQIKSGLFKPPAKPMALSTKVLIVGGVAMAALFLLTPKPKRRR